MAKLGALALAVCLAAAAPSARAGHGPASSPEAICAFRLADVQALFDAANEIAVARDALAARDVGRGASLLHAAAAALRAEAKRVAKEGKAHLAKKPRKALAKALRRASKPMKRAARKARRGAGDAAAPHAEAAAGAVATLLAEQSAAYTDLLCVGGELRVRRLHVAPGERRAVPGGAVVVAEEGVVLLGDLVVEGSPADGLEITALAGDVLLAGTIDASGAEATDAVLRSASQGIVMSQARGAGPPPATSCGQGGDVVVTALAGTLVVGGSHFAIAGHGADCAPRTVASLADLRVLFATPTVTHYTGRRGGDGGDLVYTAPNGEVRIEPRDDPELGIFEPGRGGRGEDLGFAETFELPPSDPDGLRTPISGGFGGDSGRARLGPNVLLPADLRFVYRSGAGGRGGDLDWGARSGRAKPVAADVHEIVFLGGSGGNGALEGGRGGDVRVDASGVVPEPGRDAPPLSAHGGFGGTPFEDQLLRGEEDFLLGGRGGDVQAVGARGRDGDAASPAGTAGGHVTARGGSGGWVDTQEGRNARGGDGGDASGEGGAGGDGYASCEGGLPGGPGGPGGLPGGADVHGGAGGTAAQGSGGNGGDALLARGGRPGRGGDGDPAGTCGSLPLQGAQASPGPRGGGLVPGNDGIAVAPTLQDCEPGDLASCEELPPVSCQRPRAFHTQFRHTVFRETGDFVTESVFFVSEMCTGPESCEWHWTGGTTATDHASGTSTSTSIDGPMTDIPGGHHHLNYSFHCTGGGVLHAPGEAATDSIVSVDGELLQAVFHSCAGCDCHDENFRPPSVCCPLGPNHYVPAHPESCPDALP